MARARVAHVSLRLAPFGDGHWHFRYLHAVIMSQQEEIREP